MAYRLSRIDRVKETPAWWNVGGTAFHECVREWEVARLVDAPPPSPDTQAERFAWHLADQTAKTVLDSGTAMSTWRAARGGKETREWWLDNAPQWVADYVAAALAGESVIELGQGRPMLEVGFIWNPGGGLPPVKGYIDQVRRFPNGDILVRDLKSGSHTPVDPLQLQVYRLALEDSCGIKADRWWGDYWLARKGEPARALDLTDRAPIERAVRNRLAVMDSAERAGYYPANPTSLCSACGVRASCPVMGEPDTARPWVVPILTGH